MKVFLCLWALTTVANAGLLYGGSSGFAAGVSTDSDVSFNDESGRTAGSLSSGGPTTTIRAISDVGEGSTTGGWSNGGDSSDSRCHEGGCSSGDAESVISDAEDKSSAGSAGGWPAVGGVSSAEAVKIIKIISQYEASGGNIGVHNGWR